jgi:Transcription initiation factor TFIID 23-30kDa subunit
MLDVDQEEKEEEPRESASFSQATNQQELRPPRETRKDKDLNTFLNSMDKYAPIVYSPSKENAHQVQIPDAVTDYYLSLAGFECSDQRVSVIFVSRKLTL